MSIARHHNEWLSLVPNSGPFLSLPVLAQVFPQGLDAHDADHARRLRMAFDEWDDNQLSRRPDPSIHRAWIKMVLGETLGFEELIAEGQAIPQTLKSDVAEYGETLRPDFVVNDPATKKARLLVQAYPRSQSLTKPVVSSRWKTSPDTRMMQLLHDTGIRLGIVTNGDHWMLVNAPKNETTGYASWYANLWLEEPVTLRAFRTLLGADRFFSVPENETLEALLDRSAADQQEVTDQLGYQVRKAVEVLIQSLDKADQDHGRKLLADVDEKILYESALTVMMRLVFLFCAEERELLLLGDDLYDKNFAVSTLREQLRVTADQFGEEILGLRYDAWTRLLTTFRAVFAGIKHDRLKLPAYGGSLFDPDRFPFLEGRKLGTSWKTTEATPLPVNNRTVLHLLEALQVLQVRLPGGGAAEARRLSFRSLDIEQIGHVYEGLLDHTAKRATEPVLGLAGTRDKEPEIALDELEKIAAKGEKELLKFLKDETGRSESALKKGLTAEIDDQHISRFRTACQDSELWKRVEPFAGLVRLDTVGYPVVITTGSVFVAAGTDRRSSGTHYTPKSLTEPIVRYTLEPLVYVGPAEGLPKEQWKLRSAKELLDLKICDMACGSGAFLVQACRYMAARLLEAWDAVQRANPGTLRITPNGQPSTGQPGEMLIPDDPDERQTYALRIVSQRCLYGVDKNPLAAEMAKLSLWLLTLAKDKPFEFLDHAIRCRDSLIGIHNLDQLKKFNLDGRGEDNRLFLQFLDERIKEAVALRQQITEMPAATVEDVQAQERLLKEADEKIERLKLAAHILVGAEFLRWNQHEIVTEELRDEESSNDAADGPAPGWLKAKKATESFRRAARTRAAIQTAVHFNHSNLSGFKEECRTWLNGEAPFHWPLEFAEVIVEQGGFDAFVGNPPFMGGQKITGNLGDEYREFLVTQLANGTRGSADLCAYFFLRARFLLKRGGHFGLLATNTISQGDTREVGLDQLCLDGCVISRAVATQPWPGVASLEVAHIWIRRGSWNGVYFLDEQPTEGITAFLTPKGQVSGKPYNLESNRKRAFLGSNVGSMFILEPSEADALLSKNRSYAEVIRPFLNGDDINNSPQQHPNRYAIDFRDWPLSKAAAPLDYDGPCAEDYVDCLAVIRERIENMSKDRRWRPDARKWWQFERIRKELYTTIGELPKVLAVSQTAKHHAFTFVSPHLIFSTKVVVFADSSFECFCQLSSTLHSVWVLSYGSSLETRPVYTPSDCFETFPFVSSAAQLAGYGEDFYEHRSRLLARNQSGFTYVYNLLHDLQQASLEVQDFRRSLVRMDYAVAAAYGWTELDLEHDFYKTKQGLRFTMSDKARREVLARLLKLNYERHAEEANQGLHDPKPKRAVAGGKQKSKKATPASRTRSLFDMTVVDTAFPSTDRDRLLCGLLCDLVAVRPGLASTAYLDAMVIAVRWKRHGRLLIGSEQTQFTTLSEKLAMASDRGNDSIPWTALLELLTQQEVLDSGTTLKCGSRLDTMRAAYPACDPKLIQLIHKAASTLREFQSPDKAESPDRKQVLAEFNEDKQALCGANP